MERNTSEGSYFERKDTQKPFPPSKLHVFLRITGVRQSLSEVAPHFFGTLILSDESGADKLKNMTIIAKDEKVPCSITEEVYTVVDNQTKLNLSVTQSSVEEDDPEFVRIIWEGNMSLPEGRPAGRPVKVTYSYTEDGRMKASFLDVESGNNKDIELHIDQTASTDDDFDIDQFKVE